jgi:rfaE bifunctional protein kinase chain/domain
MDRDQLFAIVARLPEVTVALLGDLVLDRFILGTPKRISREAPVIILRHEGQRDVPGGGANALANLASLGVRTVPVGVVGNDEPGTALRTELAERGIDTSGILEVPGFHTPTKVRILGGGPSSLKHQVARYDIEDTLPDDDGWRPALMESLGRAASRAAAVAVSDYGYGTVVDDALAALRRSQSGPGWVCVDSRYRIRRFTGADGATPNLQELEAASGRPLRTDVEVATAADQLRSQIGARFVLATRGNRGMTLVEEGRDPVHIPVFGTDQVADVTGAGDTVLAVLTSALAAGATPVQAAHLANLAGGLVVMKLGTATVSRDELVGAISAGGADAS